MATLYEVIRGQGARQVRNDALTRAPMKSSNLCECWHRGARRGARLASYKNTGCDGRGLQHYLDLGNRETGNWCTSDCLLTDAAIKCTGSTLHVVLDASLVRASLNLSCAPATFNGMSTLARQKNRHTEPLIHCSDLGNRRIWTASVSGFKSRAACGNVWKGVAIKSWDGSMVVDIEGPWH